MLTLEQLQNKCEEILKTLPLAHYLKVKTIPVAFDRTTQTSYFDPAQFRIVVAFNNIASVIMSKKAIPNDLELEKTIRCFLYHEVSHAIMTPNDLMSQASWYAKNGKILTPNLANIIEDERIETLLSRYYLNVDFKENLKNAAPLDKHIQSFEHFVFNCVRHRCSPISPKQVNKLVDDFIRNTKDINAMTRFSIALGTSKASYNTLQEEMNNLLIQLKKLFDMLPKEQAKQNASNSKGNGEGTEGNSSQEESTEQNPEQGENETENGNKENSSKEENSEKTGNSSEDVSSSEENDPTEESGSDNADSDESALSQAENEQNQMEESANELDSELESELSTEDIENIMENASNIVKQIANYLGKRQPLSSYNFEKDTKVSMLKIIGRNAGFGVNKTPTQYGYSGKFNTKKFATDFNDSCKWFAKRAYEDTGANNRKNNTKVLNIWLDNSGSYERNDIETNKILSALASIEKSRDDFRFNLITFDEKFVLRQGEDRVSVSNGGNRLPKEQIAKLYKQVNQNGSELNIVLFDGQASWRMTEDDNDSYANLKPFNNQKSIFITECSNTPYIQMICPKCKALITENRNYCEQLKRNILKAFDLLF